MVIGRKTFPSGTPSFTPEPKPDVSPEVDFPPNTVLQSAWGEWKASLWIWVSGDFGGT